VGTVTDPPDRAWLAEWFGSEEAIPPACEICDSGDPVIGIGGSWDEVLGICRTCLLLDLLEQAINPSGVAEIGRLRVVPPRV
jgi:hypothetical protein